VWYPNIRTNNNNRVLGRCDIGRMAVGRISNVIAEINGKMA
jgi:hypothetical protein